MILRIAIRLYYLSGITMGAYLLWREVHRG